MLGICKFVNVSVDCKMKAVSNLVCTEISSISMPCLKVAS